MLILNRYSVTISMEESFIMGKFDNNEIINLEDTEVFSFILKILYFGYWVPFMD